MNDFVITPGLPQFPVKTVLISPEQKIISDSFKSLGISILYTTENNGISNPVGFHPDMLFSHLGKNDFLIDKTQVNLKNTLCENGGNVLVSAKDLKKNYPGDIALNALIFNGALIGLIEGMAEELKQYAYDNNLELINSNQGYTGCSCIVLNSNAVITGDPSLYKIFKSRKNTDVLLTDDSEIALPGYNNGFIGGCCGKIDNGILAMTGKPSINRDSVNSFCRNHNIYIEYLSNNAVMDIGGIIPISYKAIIQNETCFA